jgi:hypothetical protein
MSEWRAVPVSTIGLQKAAYEVLEANGIMTLGELVDALRDKYGSLIEILPGGEKTLVARYIESINKARRALDRAADLNSQRNPKDRTTQLQKQASAKKPSSLR